MEFSMTFPWVWRLSGQMEIICARHTPWNFHIWTPKSQGWSAVLQWRIWQGNWLVWRSKPYTLNGMPCAFEGQGWSPDHPGSRHCLIHSDLKSPWSYNKSVPALSRPVLFQNLMKMWRKKVWEIKRKQCFQWAQVRKFYLIVKVGYYPWMSLACTSV